MLYASVIEDSDLILSIMAILGITWNNTSRGFKLACYSSA